MTCSCESDMYIDGLPCCNQYDTHDLPRHGLLNPYAPVCQLAKLDRDDIVIVVGGVIPPADYRRCSRRAPPPCSVRAP